MIHATKEGFDAYDMHDIQSISYVKEPYRPEAYRNTTRITHAPDVIGLGTWEITTIIISS